MALKKAKVVKDDPATGTEVGVFLAFIGLPETMVRALASQIAKKWSFVRVVGRQGGAGRVHECYLDYVEEGYAAFKASRHGTLQHGVLESSPSSPDLGPELPDRQAGSPDTLIADNDAESEDLALHETTSTPNESTEAVSPTKDINFDEFLYRYEDDPRSSLSPKRLSNNGPEAPSKRRRLIPTHPPTHNTKRNRGNAPKANTGARRQGTANGKALRSTRAPNNPKPAKPAKPPPRKARPTKRTPAGDSFEFSYLQLRGTYTKPLVISDNEGDSDSSSRSSPASSSDQSNGGDRNDVPPNPDSPPSTHPRKATAAPSRNDTRSEASKPCRAAAVPLRNNCRARANDSDAIPAAFMREPDTFMVRRREINEALGSLAEQRPEEWKGFWKEWKARGVV